MAPPQWIVSQIGAREHYAVPRALTKQNRLALLYTDAWCRHGRSLLQQGPAAVQSLANRYHPALPEDRVVSFTATALRHYLLAQLAGFQGRTARYFDHHIAVGKTFAKSVREDLLSRQIDLDTSIFFGYNTGSLETLNALASTGCTTVVGQIDPGRIEKEIVQEEVRRWPNWVDRPPSIYEPFETRIQKEWEAADLVVVNSKWSQEALVQQGVDAAKICVVPLAYSAPSETEPVSIPRISKNRPLRVLWLGSVILRKGIPYLVEAAHRLQGLPIQFDIVGPIGVSEEAVADAPPSVRFHGRVPRDEATSWYSSADVFVLPTLSDGFAITQLEAMAHGLPVIATPRCGQVVSDGESGFIIPVRDADALADALASLIEEPNQIGEMSRCALQTVQNFSLNRVSSLLIDTVSGFSTDYISS